jgi:metallophosphoesterase (TIGR00282 family)
MRLLMIGDVMGKPGRLALLEQLPHLRHAHHPDFIVVNAENSAAGIGITPDIADTLLKSGVDVITLGNHAWGKRDVYPYLDRESRILRPANYPPGVPGQGWKVYHHATAPVCVVALQGRAFMESVDDPFRAIDSILEALPTACKIVLVDFHAETTSEKQAFGLYVDGRVSAVVGTHTHVQTADARILPQGTAYITDVGMTGPFDSVIGMRYDSVISRFTTLLPSRFEVAEGEAQVNGVLIEVEPETGNATRITRLQVPPYPTEK